jgi:hypothetical protein
VRFIGNYKTKKSEYSGLAAFLIALVLLQLYFLARNEVVYEGADNIGHFQIARYAFKYPHLLLDLWGKPVFSTLLAPLTLLGFKGAQLFNLLVAALTLVFTWKISRIIFPKAALAVVVLTAFAPVYFLLMLTTLTEILFSFVLVVSVFLFLKNKFIFSALLLSFIPFVRTEGIIFLPVFALAFILKRSYWALPVLAFGTIFYSFIGYIVFDDLYWLLNRFPYPTGESVYGSGELFHFIKNSNFIFGIPFILLIVTGLLFWMYEIFRKFSLKDDNLILFILIAGSWIGYFAAHSFVWWQGMGGSLGLLRVIGGIIPLAALTGAKGIQLLFEKVKNPVIAYTLLVLLSGAQIYLFFVQNRLPLKAGPVDQLVAQSAAFLKNEDIEGRIFYFNPNFVFLLELDPYDSSKSVWYYGNKTNPSNAMNFGDVLIWDAHFGPNEGGVPYDLVENDPWLNKIKTFLPEERIIVLGGYEYEIHVYRKEKQKASHTASDHLTRKLDIQRMNAATVGSLADSSYLEIRKGEEFGPSMVVYASELSGKDIYEVESNVQYKSNETLSPEDVLLVASVEDGSEVLHYFTTPLEWESNDSEWKTITLNKRVPGILPDTAIIKFYVWNRGHKTILLRELSIKITGY